jgi:predicted amidohydrolase YtcJ
MRFRGIALSTIAAATLLTAGMGSAQQRRAASCEGSRNLIVENGKIHTMDAKDTIVKSVAIRDGRFLGAYRTGDADPGPCTRRINAGGRTVIPGLVDNHLHFILWSLRPGNDVRLDGTINIAEVQQRLKARAAGVKPGAWITAIGGWVPFQWAENRPPAKAELDAALPANPALIYLQMSGPAVTNSLGAAYLAAHGVAVGDDGTIAANAPSFAALAALRAIQTFDDQKDGVLHAMAEEARFGVTSVFDASCFARPDASDLQDSVTVDGASSCDPFSAHTPLLAIHDAGKMTLRVRLFFQSNDTLASVPLLNQRLLNNFDRFGDDMLRVSGVGERVTTWIGQGGMPKPEDYAAALKLVAAHGWSLRQHSLALAEDQFAVAGFEAANAATPIADLHWSVEHVPQIDAATLARIKALGAGVALHGRYISTASGPPYRMILESGIHAGAGTDAGQISTVNPWLIVYYMVTGKNAAGTLTNPGQLTTRAEALRLFTAENGWYVRDPKFGAVKPGNYGDLAILSADVFDPKKVPDEAIKKVQSVLTIVDGRVVYDGLKR